MSGFPYELAFATLLAATGVAGIVLAAYAGHGHPQRRATRPLVVALVVAVAVWSAGVLFMTLRPGTGTGQLVNLAPLTFQGPASVIDAVLNVGVFVPLGVLLAAARLRLLPTLLSGLLLSAGIELSQYLAQVGRTADINDVITNTTGTVLGWGLGAAIVHIRRRVDG